MKPSREESRWVGRVLRDKWRIDRRIARGGMGTVFAATHRNNGSTAAIKILHPEFSRDSDTRGRFLQEGYAANKVNHPGVVRILDDDMTEEGLAYLVMELLEGELLEQRRIRKGGKLPLTEVYEFADQLLDVLSAAHAKDIVHRDIKPDNIFLTTQGKLKVLDFGFAQMKTTFRPEQTATGFLLGTPGFMAPEQAIGNRPLIDARTDIWAVGATLFILLTGQPVHAGESAAEMLVAAANFPVRSIMTLEPGLPTKLAFAVDRALAFDKKDRWPDARAMQDALRAVPGRQAPKEPIRRSIPDDERRLNRPIPLDDATMMDTFEEVVDDELEKSGETQQFFRKRPDPGDHPADREEPTPPLSHPADREGRTLAMGGDGSALDEPRAGRRPGPFGVVGGEAQDASSPMRFVPAPASTQRVMSSEPPVTDETLVMDGRQFRPGTLPRPATGPPFLPGERSSFEPPSSAFPRALDTSGAGFKPRPLDPEGSRSPISAHFTPSQPIPAVQLGQTGPQQAVVSDGSSKVLVFVALAGITMILVIIVGLLVIVGSD